jgi:hypothetical protein
MNPPLIGFESSGYQQTLRLSFVKRINQAYRRSIPTSIAASKEPMTATLASTLSAPPLTLFDAKMLVIRDGDAVDIALEWRRNLGVPGRSCWFSCEVD